MRTINKCNAAQDQPLGLTTRHWAYWSLGCALCGCCLPLWPCAQHTFCCALVSGIISGRLGFGRFARLGVSALCNVCGELEAECEKFSWTAGLMSTWAFGLVGRSEGGLFILGICVKTKELSSFFVAIVPV